MLVSIYSNYTNLEWELDIVSFYSLLKIIISSMLNILYFRDFTMHTYTILPF